MKHFYQDIQGWFDFQDLYKDMVKKHDNAKFVEVGAWKGKSTCFLAVEILNQKKKIKLDAIDSYEYLTDEFSYNSRYEVTFLISIFNMIFFFVIKFRL